MALVITVTNWDRFLTLMNIDVVYLIFQDTVTSNKRKFVYIIFTTIMTCRCS